MGTALVLGLIFIPLYIHQLVSESQRGKVIKKRERIFFDRNPYATVLYTAMKGETSKWV